MRAPRAMSCRASYGGETALIPAVLEALRTLPAQQRAVVFLHDVLQWETRDVAELLGLPPTAVNGSLERARVTLERTLRGRS